DSFVDTTIHDDADRFVRARVHIDAVDGNAIQFLEQRNRTGPFIRRCRRCQNA
ncbi:MAG: hypothetical protein RL756_2817, partial [Pseudomonadota bacterium]